MTAVDLSEDDAKLILNALSAYRWVNLARPDFADNAITDLTTRIIWRDTPPA